MTAEEWIDVFAAAIGAAAPDADTRTVLLELAGVSWMRATVARALR